MLQRLVLIAAGLALLAVIIFYAAGAALPAEVSASASRTIAASPESVYDLVGHLDRWPEWTTWNAEQHPGLTLTFPGRREGTGARFEWRLGERGGSGAIEVNTAERGRGVGYLVQGPAPERVVAAEGVISLDPADGGGTRISWIHRGELRSTRQRWQGIGLERAIREDMEASLARLADLLATP